MVMAAQKRQFTGLLRKPIRLDDAKPRWPKAAFAWPRDQEDLRAHVRNEYLKRLTELDQFFGLDSNRVDIWERRAKALFAHVFGVESSKDKEWWGDVALCLATKYVPGFRIKKLRQRKRGKPQKWDDKRLAQLLADVEFRKRGTRLSVSRICKLLPMKLGYEKRWGSFKDPTLRKAYLEAKRRRSDWNFELLLCGPKAVLEPGSTVDRMDAAIEIHALKL
jgi:hypothetical protein